MSRLVVVALCLQACLIQTALSQQCGCTQNISYGPSKVGISVSAPNLSGASLGASSYSGSYGGTGTGQVGVTGDIGASGQTCVVGSVPVLGSVEFNGKVPATGSVSISGQCGCGCN